MPNTAAPPSLITLFTGDNSAEWATAPDRFSQIFSLCCDERQSPPNSVPILIRVDELGRNSLNRISFFSDSTTFPIFVMPLLARAVWNRPEVGSIVFSYPGVPFDRASAACTLLDGGCEAVLLRSDDYPPLVLALSRNARNERMLAHWADSVERFVVHNREGNQNTYSLHGGRMAEYLCDAIGSVRLHEPVSFTSFRPLGRDFPVVVRQAIESLLPESKELFDDPFRNAEQVLNSPAPQVAQESGCLLTRLMVFIWSLRADLQETFDLCSPSGRHGFVEWFLDRASIEFGIDGAFINPVAAAKTTPPLSASTLRKVSFESPRTEFSTGVNLIGYPRAEMGMGEQLRNCAAALEAAKVPFIIRDFNHGLIASNRDSQFEHLICNDNPFDVNLFHVNADQIGLVLEKLGPAFFRDRYNIGYWEWELSNFPDEWLRAIDFMDEIWAPSKFIAEAITKKTTKPVIWMPLAVEFPVPIASGKPLRLKLGLPDDQFLFLFAFDFSSFSTRKNYVAAIEAFQQAFDSSDENVGLVLKTIRHARHASEFWELLRRVGDDKRVHVVDRVLRKPEMRELISSCDALLSLHRSEGFGLAIAEAMYLGKPVIVTNYSGNVDFTRADNSCPVNYRLVPVEAGQYVFPEGQVWADPDVPHAASFMRQLVEDRNLGKQLGAAASRSIRRQHNFRVVGNKYSQRLQQIGSARNMLSSFPPEPDQFVASGDTSSLAERVKGFSKALFK